MSELKVRAPVSFSYLLFSDQSFALHGRLGGEVLQIVPLDERPTEGKLNTLTAVVTFPAFEQFAGVRIASARTIGSAWNGHGFEFSFDGMYDRTMSPVDPHRRGAARLFRLSPPRCRVLPLLVASRRCRITRQCNGPCRRYTCWWSRAARAPALPLIATTLGGFTLMDIYSLTTIGAVALGAVGIGVVMRRFALDRKQQRISPFELTDEEKVEIAEWRHKLHPLRLLTGLLGAIGGFAVLAGIVSVAGLDSSGKPDWAGGIDCFLFGGILILFAVLLSKRFK